MAVDLNRDQWVRYNPLTHTYDTSDGTSVPAEVIHSAQCLADIVRIAGIREKQREKLNGAKG